MREMIFLRNKNQLQRYMVTCSNFGSLVYWDPKLDVVTDNIL